MKTDLITYNLKDRGRDYRGQDRAYSKEENLPRLVSAINSDETQERVRNRDMQGYYGHWIRLKFGLIPQECKIVDGKVACVEPAFVTTHLRAYDDGVVEHREEFAQTKAGELAWKLFNSRTGGFSSAIDESKPEFFGFDYVLEPNFTTNRGYTLDSVMGELMDSSNDMEAPCVLDSLMYAEYEAGLNALSSLIDQQAEEQENLLSMRLALDSNSEYERRVKQLEIENDRLYKSLQAARSDLKLAQQTDFKAIATFDSADDFRNESLRFSQNRSEPRQESEAEKLLNFSLLRRGM